MSGTMLGVLVLGLETTITHLTVEFVILWQVSLVQFVVVVVGLITSTTSIIVPSVRTRSVVV